MHTPDADVLRFHTESADALEALLAGISLPALYGADDDGYAQYFAALSAGQVLSAARAVHVLQASGLGYQSLAFVRMQFESIIRTAFVAHIDTGQARRYFLSAPLERLMLARQYGAAAGIDEATLQADAVATLRDHPDLTAVHREDATKLTTRELAKILNGLRFHHVPKILAALREQHPGWTDQLYFGIFRNASQYIHQTVLDADRFFDRSTGTLVFYPAARPQARPDLLMQSASYLGGAAAYLEQFFSGTVGDATRARLARQKQLSAALANSARGNELREDGTE